MNRYIIGISIFLIVCIYILEIWNISFSDWLVGFVFGIYFSVYVELICVRYLNKQEKDV